MRSWFYFIDERSATIAQMVQEVAVMVPKVPIPVEERKTNIFFFDPEYSSQAVTVFL